ncbi:transcriptional regulatory protein [Trichosporon asahii var. asahii CBS 8904]|uniref:Transcriptional regulatory protein n=1 Tax=Trichosporon asahii var. asahii (strain CBS 8904) TaxID=1220162 RepID=K1WNX6_TRIAC|nr:transcriptional regulatory protein [Trichosporon asahii var. asahii CBS 8904]
MSAKKKRLIVSGTEELHERIHELEMALAAEFRKTSAGELHPLLRAERTPETDRGIWVRPATLVAGCLVGSGLSLTPRDCPPLPPSSRRRRNARALTALASGPGRPAYRPRAGESIAEPGEGGGTPHSCNTLLVEPIAARGFADAARTLADASTAGVQAGAILAEYAANDGRLGDAWAIAGEALVRAHGIGLPEPDIEIRRTTYWELVGWSRVLGLLLGRPNQARNDAGDAKPPQGERYRLFSLLESVLDLVRRHTATRADHQTTSATPVSLDALRRADDALSALRNDLPPIAIARSVPPANTVGALTLRLLVSFARLMLCSPAEALFSTAYEAANECLETQRRWVVFHPRLLERTGWVWAVADAAATFLGKVVTSSPDGAYATPAFAALTGYVEIVVAAGRALGPLAAVVEASRAAVGERSSRQTVSPVQQLTALSRPGTAGNGRYFDHTAQAFQQHQSPETDFGGYPIPQLQSQAQAPATAGMQEFQRGFSMPPPRVPIIPQVPRIDTQFAHPSHQTAPPHPQPSQARDDAQPWSSYELLPPGLGLDIVFSPRRGSVGMERERAPPGTAMGRAMSLPALPAEMALMPQVGQQSPQQILGMSPLMPSPSPMSEQEAPFFSRPGTAS